MSLPGSNHKAALLNMFELGKLKDEKVLFTGGKYVTFSQTNASTPTSVIAFCGQVLW